MLRKVVNNSSTSSIENIRKDLHLFEKLAQIDENSYLNVNNNVLKGYEIINFVRENTRHSIQDNILNPTLSRIWVKEESKLGNVRKQVIKLEDLDILFHTDIFGDFIYDMFGLRYTIIPYQYDNLKLIDNVYNSKDRFGNISIIELAYRSIVRKLESAEYKYSYMNEYYVQRINCDIRYIVDKLKSVGILTPQEDIVVWYSNPMEITIEVG